MEFRTLGKTGLKVSRLGLGLARIDGFGADDVDVAGRLFNATLDGGINFIDTAAKYGNAEELIGRTVSDRRDEFVLASKFGSPWTHKDVSESIDRSLTLMKTDRIDLMQVHSAGVEDLERGELIDALTAARSAGKVLHIGYAGDNEAAEWAVNSGVFETLQTSFNLADQSALKTLFPEARKAGMGVIAKRPIANSSWGGDEAHAATTGQYQVLKDRCSAIAGLGPITGMPADRIEFALQFTLAHEEVDSAIVGTTIPDHISDDIRIANSAPALSPSTVEELHRRFDTLGADWPQLT